MDEGRQMTQKTVMDRQEEPSPESYLLGKAVQIGLIVAVVLISHKMGKRAGMVSGYSVGFKYGEASGIVQAQDDIISKLAATAANSIGE